MKLTVFVSLLLKYKSEPKIFTYSVGANSDRFQLRRLACVTGGGYYEIGSANSSSAVVRRERERKKERERERKRAVLTLSLSGLVELPSASAAPQRLLEHRTSVDK